MASEAAHDSTSAASAGAAAAEAMEDEIEVSRAEEGANHVASPAASVAGSATASLTSATASASGSATPRTPTSATGSRKRAAGSKPAPRLSAEEVTELKLPKLGDGEFYMTNQSDSAFMTYFQPFSSNDLKDHICLLCHARLKLVDNDGKKLSIGNAKTHLLGCKIRKRDYPRMEVCNTMPPFPRRSTGTGAIDNYVVKNSRAPRHLTDSTNAALGYKDALLPLSDAAKKMIEEDLVMMCVENLLPYSFVEWGALRMLINHLLELGGRTVSGRPIF